MLTGGNVQEYKLISSKRIACFYSSEPQPHHFTILVRGIPASGGNSFSESVDLFFREYHPSSYLSHTVVRRTSRLQKLMVSIVSFFKPKKKKEMLILFFVEEICFLA